MKEYVVEDENIEKTTFIEEKKIMKYTAKYFKENTPEWKKKRDSIIGRLFYRPISYVLASIAANWGISANSVSYFSACVAAVACGMFLIKNNGAHVIGAILMMVWGLLDDIDGNLARCVKKEPFGEFADSISSYILVGFLGTTMGIAVYFEGGLIFRAGNPWIIFAGAMASSSDTMMRLIYQKYKNTERKLADSGVIEIEDDFKTEKEQPTSIKSIMDREFGLAAIVIITLITSVLKCLDIAVLYALLYYGSAFVANLYIYVTKAVRESRKDY